MLVCDGITKSFDAFTAVEDVSFTVEDGSICGLVGYNGAGKTTLLKIAASIYRPDKGGFLFDGKLSTGEEKTRQEIFLLPDVFYYLPQATLRSMAAFYSGYYPTWSVDTYHKLLELFDPKECSGRRTWLLPWLASRIICCWMKPSMDWIPPSAIWCAVF